MAHPHPWFKVLIKNPHEEIHRLVMGFAQIFPYRNLEAQSAAFALTSSLERDSIEFKSFDDGCLSVLKEFVILLKSQPPVPWYLARISSLNRLLQIILKVKPENSVNYLKENQDEWESFLKPLVVDEKLDVLFTYKLIINTQS